MTFRNKLWGLVLFLILCNLISLLFFANNMKTLGYFHRESSNWSRHAFSITKLSTAIDQYYDAIKEDVLFGEKMKKESLLQRREDVEHQIKESQQLAENFSKEETEEEKEMDEKIQVWLDLGWRVWDLNHRSLHAAARRVFEVELRQAHETLRPVLLRRIKEEEEDLMLWSQKAATVTQQALFIGAGLLIVFSFASVLMTLLITFFFGRKFTLLIDGYQKIVHGFWDHRIDLKSRDEFAQLARGFNRMAQAICDREESLKKSQAVLVQSEKMSAVGQLAAGIAHEINNPLGIILGFAQGLKYQLKGVESAPEALDFIEKEALRCVNLVKNLLVFSRTSRAEERVEIDISETIEGALSLVTTQSRVKNVDLSREFTTNLPKIAANQNQIQQIIINLCNNAMDAMTGNGKIFIRTGQTWKNGKNWVTFEVQDTGSGISKDIQSKIFEPFFTTKTIGKGTGLGLSLVHELVQKHHGIIEVSSEIGRGTTFTIFLPVQAVDVQKAA